MRFFALFLTALPSFVAAIHKAPSQRILNIMSHKENTYEPSSSTRSQSSPSQNEVITILCDVQKVHVMQNDNGEGIEWHCTLEPFHTYPTTSRPVFLLEGSDFCRVDDNCWAEQHKNELNGPNFLELQGVMLTREAYDEAKIHVPNNTKKTIIPKRQYFRRRTSEIPPPMKESMYQNREKMSPNRKSSSFSVGKFDSLDGRRLRSTTGTKTVLVLRISASDSTNFYPANILSDRVFGNGFSLASQLHSCSNGQIQFIRATGQNINNGVAEISVPQKAIGTEKSIILNAAKEAAMSVVGDPSRFDHVIMCFPFGTTFGNKKSWAAFAYMPDYELQYLSVFNDDWCGKPSILMHEIGHNLGLFHSNRPEQKYNDKTGLMGYSYKEDYGPRMCFNAAKSWQLGWYENRHKTVHPLDGASSAKLVGVNDFKQTTSEHVVVLKIHASKPLFDPWGDGESEALYLMYNRQEGMNDGTQEAKNKVTVVKSSLRESELLAILGQNMEYRINNFEGTGNDLVIKVGFIFNGRYPDYAMVDVFVDKSCQSDNDCQNGNVCDGTEKCVAGICRPDHDFQSCNDGDICTADMCHPKEGCRNVKGLCDCDDDQISFGLELRTDGWGKETSWSLENGNGEFVLSTTEQSYGNHQTITEGPFCIPESCHIFTIKDGFGDGIAGGGFTYYIDGVPHHGPEFKENASFDIGDCGGEYANLLTSQKFGLPSQTPSHLPSQSPSSAPTQEPSHSGSLSPTVGMICAPDEISFELDIHTDQWGEETSWDLTDTSNKIIRSVPEDTYGMKWSYHEGPICVQKDDCYTLTMKDRFGDGIANGSFTYTIDGVVYYGPKFNRETMLRFGSCS